MIEEIQLLLLPPLPKTCKKCNTNITFRAKFCYHCGEALNHNDELKTCKNCFATMPLKALYCPGCKYRVWMQGSTVEGTEIYAHKVAQEEVPTQKFSKDATV